MGDRVLAVLVHIRTKYIRFILGGNDNNGYPGFNDQFT